MCLSPWGKYPVVRLLDQKVDQFLVLSVSYLALLEEAAVGAVRVCRVTCCLAWSSTIECPLLERGRGPGGRLGVRGRELGLSFFI